MSNIKNKGAVVYEKGGRVHTITKSIESVESNLLPGFYEVISEETMFGVRHHLSVAEVDLPTSSRKFSQEFIDFAYLKSLFTPESKALHIDLGAKRKLGICLYGPQGTGKTTVAYDTALYLMETEGAVVFSVKNFNEFEFIVNTIKDARKVAPFVAVCIWDECEDDFRAKERNVKPYLDGQESLNDFVLIACTNYRERIPDTIIDRPSRFRDVIEIGPIKDEVVVNQILVNMNNSLTAPIEDTHVNALTRDGVGCTMDELKTKFVDKCFSLIGSRAPVIVPEDDPEDKKGGKGWMEMLYPD